MLVIIKERVTCYKNAGLRWPLKESEAGVDLVLLATLIDWLKKTPPVFVTTEKQKNQSHLVRSVFPFLRASYRKLPGILVG